MLEHTTDHAVRIVADDKFQPDEYDASLEFIGWELDHEQGNDGWDLIVRDAYHNVELTVRYTSDGRLTTDLQHTA